VTNIHNDSLSMIRALLLKLNLESKKVMQHVNKFINNFEVDVYALRIVRRKIMQLLAIYNGSTWCIKV
jgi:hypothetical protein